MLRSLFGKIPTRDEIERDVNQQIESLARSGHNPPPAGWTVAGGMPASERPETPERPSASAAPMHAEVAEADLVETDTTPGSASSRPTTRRPRAATKPPAARTRATAAPSTSPKTATTRSANPKTATRKPAAPTAGSRKQPTTKPARKPATPRPTARKVS